MSEQKDPMAERLSRSAPHMYTMTVADFADAVSTK